MLIESIGKEKSVVDEAVESSRADEEAASALSVSAVPLQIRALRHAVNGSYVQEYCTISVVLIVTFYIMQHDVALFQAECARDLAVAEPIITAAEKALNSLDKASLGELKSFTSPSAEIVAVLAACMILTAPNGKIPKVFSDFASSIHTYR